MLSESGFRILTFHRANWGRGRPGEDSIWFRTGNKRLSIKADLASKFPQHPSIPNQHILLPTLNFLGDREEGAGLPPGSSLYNPDVWSLPLLFSLCALTPFSLRRTHPVLATPSFPTATSLALVFGAR